MSDGLVPTGFDWLMNGLYYKRGSHGFVYVWLNGVWQKSTKHESQMKSGHTTARERPSRVKSRRSIEG